ncbi:MAG TPA: hypothetical protein VKR06_09025 [Ktedonosporobacter sp.]|nr:hypothetical protein [Ktedonosporobacter sp.]
MKRIFLSALCLGTATGLLIFALFDHGQQQRADAIVASIIGGIGLLLALIGPKE